MSKMTMYESKIGWCYNCGQGWVCIVKTKDDICYCLCDECEVEWDSPENYFNRYMSASDKFDTVVYLSDTDVENHEWKRYIISN